MLTTSRRALRMIAGLLSFSSLALALIFVAAGSKADTCTHTYRHASNGDGYPGRMRLVWDLTFTDADAPIDLAGLPTSFSSPWAEVTVPVREI